MDFCVGMDVWNKLSPKMKQWVEDEIQVYSRIHHARDPEGRHGSLGQVREGRHRDQPAAGRGPARSSSASPCRSGSNGPTRTRTPRASSRLQLEIMESPDLRLRHARHVQGPEARPLSAARRGRACGRDCEQVPSFGIVVHRGRPAGVRGARCPALHFVLPHWLYWGTLIVFPLVAIYLVRAPAQTRRAARAVALHRLSVLAHAPASWACTGSTCGAPGASSSSRSSSPSSTATPRSAMRARTSRARARPSSSAHTAVDRAKPSPGATPTPRGKRALAEAAGRRQRQRKTEFDDAAGASSTTGIERRRAGSRSCWRRCCSCDAHPAARPGAPAQRARSRRARRRAADPLTPADVAERHVAEDPTLHVHTRVHRRDRMGQRQRRRVRRLLGA